ncbi:D-2-hydroxyacid dehydrogenase [Alkalihalophilus sp. As8PL]|uniref:D-2-hydroxyacid dehydrogenase n=1 Tax=Alkalihalophilus sp. As8PL TaxID=3237103 RepID=A0AB39BXC1_9BACI
MKVVSSARIKEDIQQQMINDFPEVDFMFYKKMNEVGEDLSSCEVLITYGEDLTSERIEEAKKLKWIMVIAAGLEKIPFDTLLQKGILVTNCRGIHAKPMGEYTISMMLQMARKTKELIASEKQSNWNRKIPMMELNGKTVGILGAGAIGQEVARLSQAFGMKTLGMNSTGKSIQYIDEMYTEKTVETLLEKSHFVVNILPHTEKTQKFMSEERFSAMKKDAYLINIGRGKTVDEQALEKVLEEGHLAHASLDVFETEPLTSNHSFWNHEKVTVTPHISGISSEYQTRAFEIVKKNLKTFIEGNDDFINRIDLTKGY